MGVLTTAGKNTVLDSGLPATLYAALHSGAPGADGSANELTGGTPAYARKAVTMAAASGGSRAATGAVTFDVPAGATVSHGSLWTAETGGTCVFTDDLPAAETFAGQGTYTLATTTLSLTD
ncbi:phage tail fiber protein [Solidesulfovibrio sp.]